MPTQPLIDGARQIASPFIGSLVSHYSFPSQTPAQTLSAGSNVITLNPFPSGISASLSPNAHYLYITDGTSGNEAVLITATNGSSTVTVTCGLGHTSGQWSIASASGGLQEAIYAVSGTQDVLLWVDAALTLHQVVSVGGSIATFIRGMSSANQIIRASDYANGNLIKLNTTSPCSISYLTINNETAAAQSTAYAIFIGSASNAGHHIHHLYASGGNEIIRSDGGNNLLAEFLRFDSGAHSTTFINLTGATAGAGCNDVVIHAVLAFANKGSFITVGAADGVTVSKVLGGGGGAGGNADFAVINSEAAPRYVSNITFDDWNVDAGGAGKYVVNISAGSNSAGNIHLHKIHTLSGNAAGVLSGTGVGNVLIEACHFDGCKGTAVTQSGAVSWPMLIVGCLFSDNNSTSTANTPDIFINGGNAAVIGCSFRSPLATWNVISESTTSNFVILGNNFYNFVTAGVSLTGPFSTKPTAYFVQGNSGSPDMFLWTALPALQNSWATTSTGTFGTGQYTTDGSQVFVTGELSGGTQTDGTLILTMPTGYRPQVAICKAICAVSGGGAVLGLARIFIATNGQILVYGINGLTTPLLDFQFSYPLF